MLLSVVIITTKSADLHSAAVPVTVAGMSTCLATPRNYKVTKWGESPQQLTSALVRAVPVDATEWCESVFRVCERV